MAKAWNLMWGKCSVDLIYKDERSRAVAAGALHNTRLVLYLYMTDKKMFQTYFMNKSECEEWDMHEPLNIKQNIS